MTYNMDDAKFLKKHIKTGAIDVHPTEKALIVNYELEATILGELGDPMIGDKKECQKIIRLKDLNETTDIAALATEVINKCKLIPPNKLAEVEQLLYYLQRRRNHDASDSGGSVLTTSNNKYDLSDVGVTEVKEVADVEKLDEYIELLYEDIGEKVRGTALVLQLARNPNNLEELMQNETLLGALARVLREDWKKSLEVATNISYIFFCFSTFSQFHAMISHFKIGALCVQILEYELKRGELAKEEPTKKAMQSPERTDKTARTKLQYLSKKQDQLLRVVTYLLLNMAEDPKTELKMVNRSIVELLCQLVNRTDNAELLGLALMFLKRLSIYTENKNQMLKLNPAPRMVKILSATKNTELVGSCLRLLFNLSFDAELRAKMVAAGILPVVVPIMNSNSAHRTTALALLYHLSMDDKCKAMFTYTDCVQTIMKLLAEADNRVPTELAALAINLALNKRNAQLMCATNGDGLRTIMHRAFKMREPLMLKIARNIAEHDGETKPMFIEYVCDLAGAIQKQVDGSEDFIIECVGILTSLTIAELDLLRLLEEYDLISWMQRRLLPGATDDDLLLEIVMLTGTLAADEKGADIIYNRLLTSLISLLSAKQEDDEIVLQIVYVFYHMLCFERIRNSLVTSTQVPAYLIDLMHDKNPEIRKLCDMTLEVVAETGEEWSKKIMEEKFRWHNAQWLEMVGQAVTDKTRVLDDEDEVLSVASDNNLFSDVYGVNADDFLQNYGADRPVSRMEHRPGGSRTRVDDGGDSSAEDADAAPLRSYSEFQR